MLFCFVLVWFFTLCVTHVCCGLDVSKTADLLIAFYFPPDSCYFPPNPALASHTYHCKVQNAANGIPESVLVCVYSILHVVPTGLFFLLLFLCQIFEGNSNYDTPELRTVEPLLTRFIRIYPERATPAGMGLRLELLGCEIEGEHAQHKNK